VARRARDVEFFGAGDGQQLPRDARVGMTAMFALIMLSLLLGGGGLALFLWALRSGQYDDLEGGANRILYDDVEK
jgi:cbb3-type cytochrome oxidase maturation protein